MKKLFLIPLMACMMCLSVGAANVATSEELQAAFAGESATITLTADIELASGITIGTKNGTEAKKTFTLDLNGHSLTTKSGVMQTFVLNRGNLTVKNSVPGVGGIYNLNDQYDAGVHKYNSNYIIFNMYGSTTPSCDSETAAISELQSYLCVEEGVNLFSAVNAIVVTETGKYAETSTSVSFNVRIDFKGAINPGEDQGKYGIKPNGTIGYVEAAKLSSPFIHVFPSATINVTHNVKKAVAAYSSGYARWMIEGTLTGATALYIKSGEIVMDNAVAESTWTDEATLTIGKNKSGSGVEGGGNAVVVESHESYAGAVNLTVKGDSKLSTEAENGAAMTETVSATASKVETINIEGGNFSSGEGGNAIVISNKTLEEDVPIEVNGVTLVGGVLAGDDDGATALADLMPANTHTTVITNEDGSKTTIISDGAAPAGQSTWAAVEALAEGTAVNWTGTEAVVIGDSVTATIKRLGEFQMISGTSANKQNLTIKNNAELHVDRLILNDYARIVVEAGGKLVVEGEQGINAPSADNILLKTTETNPSYFLFNPAVASNRHPQAKVDMWSKACQYTPGRFIWQRFGFPGWNENVKLKDVLFSVPTAAYTINTTGANINDWSFMSAEDEFIPFASYILTTSATTEGATYTFACNMAGNENAPLSLYSHYNYFGNSYTAPIDIESLISDFEDRFPNVSATIYLYLPESDTWRDINYASLWYDDECPLTIEPMRAFVVIRDAAGDAAQIDYENGVWNPMMNPAPAPARRMSNAPFAFANIEIVDEEGKADRIGLVESAQFSAEFDNAYDAEKLINGDNAYIYADGCRGKMGIVATDNLEGMKLSMTTVENTSYMLNVRGAKGLDYAIRDMLTGTEIELKEGESYMFSVPANTTVEGRFQIVGVRKVATAVGEVEINTAAKGIFTVTGQFVGTNFHALPAGVYVVDGKKVVK